MSSFLYADNDEYENIPLMDGHSSQQTSSFSRSNRDENDAVLFIKNNFKKIAFGVFLLACVFFFYGSTNEDPNSPDLKTVSNSLTLEPNQVKPVDALELPSPGSGMNYTQDHLNEEFLNQYKEVYPNGDDDLHHDYNEDDLTTELESEEERFDDKSEKITFQGASILDWSISKKDEKDAQGKQDEDDDSNDGKETSNKKKKSGNKSRRRRHRRNKNKQNKKQNAFFDLAVLKKAIQNDQNNPFTVDYHSIIGKMSKQYKTLSGDIDSSTDYSLRKYRTHKGHMNEDDLELFHSLRFFHISDTHIDAFFNPYQSSQQGVCASCKLNSKIYGDAAYCPLSSPFKANILNTKAGYSFGRYRCNPPPQLLASMLSHIRSHQRAPAFFLITGDIGAHGMPSDTFPVNEDSKLIDFCPTKFNGMRATLEMFRELFPDTPILFTPGNNDHLPKNKVWTPYFEAFAALLVEFNLLHPSQAATFSRIGSHYVDLEVDNQKYVEFIKSQAKDPSNAAHISKKMTEGLDNIPKITLLRAVLPDMTLLAPGGEASFVDSSLYEHLEGLERENIEFPKRAELVHWLNSTLFDAEKEGRFVLFAGHQPLTTKKGSNELLLTTSTHGLLFKALLAQYAHIITSSYFGHRNLASIQNILSPSGDQVIPSLTIPGVSPRGLNQPAFMELALSRTNGRVLDFEQYVFDLMEENEKAQILTSSLKQFLPTEVLIADTNHDSGSTIVHEVIAARVTDNYDPESYAKHKEEEDEIAKKEKAAKFEEKVDKTTQEKIINNLSTHGIDCGDDEELCQFLKKWGYVGRWVKNPEDISSWRKMTGFTEFTPQTVFDMNSRIPTSGKLYTALQVFKRAGLIGDSAPEAVWCQSLYDDEEMMMKCLFPEQDETEGCFAKSWIK
jgi:hypothetical protein